MFKSVFTKYITAFMLIILISFTVLAGIISSMVTNYSFDSKQDILKKTGSAIQGFLEERYANKEEQISGANEQTNFNWYLYNNKANLNPTISTLVRFTSDVVVIITDTTGMILMTDDRVPAGYLQDFRISKEIMDEINNGKEIAQLDDLDGLFLSRHLIYATPILYNNYVLGTVFACASSTSVNELIETMIKTIIMSSLWVMLAALVAVYFISEKVIGPLKAMSKAAKSFAAGKFDVRVPVTGRDEVAELATAFNNMAGSLASLEDMRRTFLANVSHDLRTPMTTISGFIDGILQGAIPPEKHQYYLNVIATEVRRLSRLVSSLLDISRIQAGERKFSKTAFDICEMARQILISFEQKIDEKKLDVEFDCAEENMHVYADRDAIYQILYNICDNGVKFSKVGGKFAIHLVEKDRKVYTSVRNEGMGIPEEDLPYVFDRFYKSDRSRGLDKTGVGLGLYIAKTIIDSHEEEIWVKSVYGEYCEFVFTLQRTHETPAKKIDPH